MGINPISLLVVFKFNPDKYKEQIMSVRELNTLTPLGGQRTVLRGALGLRERNVTSH